MDSRERIWDQCKHPEFYIDISGPEGGGQILIAVRPIQNMDLVQQVQASSQPLIENETRAQIRSTRRKFPKQLHAADTPTPSETVVGGVQGLLGRVNEEV